jgi:peptide/nickel transport system ATP-binding protein
MRNVAALHDIDLEVRRGEILAILGNSGAGKTTLSRCLVGMEQADAGSIVFGGQDLARLSSRSLRRIRPQLQILFQDSSTALNPRLTAEELIAEPLLIQRLGTSESRCEKVVQLMREVGLSPEWRYRRPSEFSGGQLQRVAIARALSIEPTLLVLDEAFTGLDLSTAAQIANLLLDIRSRRDLTYILISHDIALAAQLADEIAVMEAGTIVERGRARTVLESPQAPATRALLGAATAMNRAIALAAGESA